MPKGVFPNGNRGSFKKGSTVNVGRVWSAESRAKVALAGKNRIVKPETREKLRKAMIGRKITWGDKMSVAQKGKLRGRTISTTLRAMFKEKVSKIGKHYSPATEFKKGMTPWIKGKKGVFIPANKGKRNPTVAGEKNWNWKGGITPKNKLIRLSPEYKNWRETVFARDDYTCQACGEKGCYLHPHHINSFAYFPDERFILNNGIALCVECHRHIHQMEKMSGISLSIHKEGFLS